MEENKFQFKCDFCEKSFFNEEILGLHINSNHKSIIEGWKKCVFCDKTYHSKHSLNQHVRMRHSKAKGYECETCSKVFFKKNMLNMHKKSVHESEKPFHVKNILLPKLV